MTQVPDHLLPQDGYTLVMAADLPTFYEIKAEDLPPFGQKTRKIFMLGKYSDILSADDTELAHVFPFQQHQTT